MTGKLAITYCSSWLIWILDFSAVSFCTRQVIFLFSYRHHREKKDDGAPEPEADPERDQRTVFAYQVFPVTCLLSVK